MSEASSRSCKSLDLCPPAIAASGAHLDLINPPPALTSTRLDLQNLSMVGTIVPPDPPGDPTPRVEGPTVIINSWPEMYRRREEYIRGSVSTVGRSGSSTVLGEFKHAGRRVAKPQGREYLRRTVCKFKTASEVWKHDEHVSISPGMNIAETQSGTPLEPVVQLEEHENRISRMFKTFMEVFSCVSSRDVVFRRPEPLPEYLNIVPEFPQDPVRYVCAKRKPKGKWVRKDPVTAQPPDEKCEPIGDDSTSAGIQAPAEQDRSRGYNSESNDEEKIWTVSDLSDNDSFDLADYMPFPADSISSRDWPRIPDSKKVKSKKARRQRDKVNKRLGRTVNKDTWCPDPDPGSHKNDVTEPKDEVETKVKEEDRELKDYEINLKINVDDFDWFLNEELAFNRRHAITIGFNKTSYSVDCVLAFNVGRESERNTMLLPVVYPATKRVKDLHNEGFGISSTCGNLIGIDKDIAHEDDLLRRTATLRYPTMHDFCMSILRSTLPDIISRGALMTPQLLYNKCRSACRTLIGPHTGIESYLCELTMSSSLSSLIESELISARNQYLANLENSIRMKIAKRGLSYDYEKSFCYFWETCWMILRSLGLAVTFGLVHHWWLHHHNRYEQAVSERLNKQLGRHEGNFMVIPAAYSLHKQNFPEERSLNDEVELDSEVSLEVEDRECVDDEIENYGSFTYAPMVYPNGRHNRNLEASLRIRMGQPLLIDKGAMASFGKHFKKMVSTWSLDVSDSEPLAEFLLRKYPAKKAANFLRAAEEPLDSKDAWSTIFVKGEPYLGKRPDNYKPRMIWSRSDRIMRFGPQFAQLSKQLSKYLNFHSRAWYSNGAHPADVGEYAEKISDDTYIFEMDVSNWDGSLCKHILDLELWFLRNKVHGWSDDVEFLFDNWTNVWGYSSDRSVRYMSRRGRRSGDFWTSSLNSLLNVAFVTWATGLDLYSDEFHLMVLGDDNVLGCNKPLSAEEVVFKYSQIGLTLDCVRRDDIRETSFCSGLFWVVGEKLVWGNLPFRALSKLGMNHHKHPKHIMQQLLHGTAKGVLSTSGHEPIFGAICRAICDSAEELKIRSRSDRRDEWEGRIKGNYTQYPTMSTYAQFSSRYNIPIPLILEIEELIESSLSINSFPCFLGGSLMYEGVKVDLGISEEELCIPKGMSPRMYAVSYAPAIEERAKLFMAQEYGLIGAADTFALLEDPDGSTLWQHRVFTLVSSIHLETGIALHSRYNSLAFDYGTVCAKGIKKKKKKKPPGKPAPARRKKRGPKAANGQGNWRSAVGNVLRAGGAAIGSSFGGPLGGTLGGLVGGGIARISGMGAYTVTSNSLGSANVEFGNGKIVVAHREYITDIYTESAFTTLVFDLNPGLSVTYPWLAGLAQLYQRYEIKGLSFEYIHTGGMVTSSQSQGVIIMATQYDPDAVEFVNRREMEAYMYTTSGPVFQDQLHMVECDPRERPLAEMYIRTGTVTEERFTDLGRFTIGVEGCPTSDEFVGELWVTYHVELHCPIVEPHAYSTASSSWISNAGYDTTDLLGLVQTTPRGGDLGITVGAIGGGYDTIYFPSMLDSGIYLVCVAWDGSTTGASVTTVGSVGCTKITCWQSDTLTQSTSNGSVATLNYIVVVQVTAREAYLTFTSVIPPTSGTSVDIVVAQIANPLAAVQAIETYSQALKMRGTPLRHPQIEKSRTVVDFHNEEKYEDHVSEVSMDCDWKEEPGPSRRPHRTERHRVHHR